MLTLQAGYLLQSPFSPPEDLALPWSKLESLEDGEKLEWPGIARGSYEEEGRERALGGQRRGGGGGVCT